MTLRHRLSRCVYPECPATIQPYELACPQHAALITDGMRRQWRRSWILFRQGVPTSIDPAIRVDHERRLTTNLILARANAYRILAQGIERREYEHAAVRARETEQRHKDQARAAGGRASAARRPRAPDGRFLPKP